MVYSNVPHFCASLFLVHLTYTIPFSPFFLPHFHSTFIFIKQSFAGSYHYFLVLEASQFIPHLFLLICECSSLCLLIQYVPIIEEQCLPWESCAKFWSILSKISMFINLFKTMVEENLMLFVESSFINWLVFLILKLIFEQWIWVHIT